MEERERSGGEREKWRREREVEERERSGGKREKWRREREVEEREKWRRERENAHIAKGSIGGKRDGERDVDVVEEVVGNHLPLEGSNPHHQVVAESVAWNVL